MAEQNSISSARTTQAPRSLVYFDDRTALHLTQAFSQEVDLEPLLGLLFAQLAATGDVRGLQYVYEPLGIDLNFGERDQHTADYNLSFRDSPLGKLVLCFARPQHEQGLQTCEDLISMAFIALRNAVTIMDLRNKPATLSPAEQDTVTSLTNPRKKLRMSEAGALPKEDKTDALILLALDEYPEIKSRAGEEWAQILMSSVHEQVREGLRGADGVYHIGDDLIAILLPHTTRGQAEDVAKKVRALIASLHLRGGEISQQLTACMGLADASSAGTAEEVMANAKAALAAAQAEGTNQISIYSEDAPDKEPHLREVT